MNAGAERGQAPRLPSADYSIAMRGGHPGLVELDWPRSIREWRGDLLVDLPLGISRHEVRLVRVDGIVLALKELPLALARRDYDVLRKLEELEAPAVRPVGLVVRTAVDPGAETAAVLITRYAEHTMTYRTLLLERGFGTRRAGFLEAFAWLLVELHSLGCFWGDCSMSNVLYRYDAAGIETIMVDAETAAIHPTLSDGQRLSDIEVMVENLAGEAGDIAASRGLSLDDADLGMGEEIAGRYDELWAVLGTEQLLTPDEGERVGERIHQLTELGVEVDQIEVEPGSDSVTFRVRGAHRNLHRNRLHRLTGVEAGENQARTILADLRYYQRRHADTTEVDGRSPAGKALLAARWRATEFEPWLERLAPHVPPGGQLLQTYCDLLHHRYMLSVEAGEDVGTQAAFEHWLLSGKPGYD